MNHLIRMTFALAAGTLAVPALAAGTSTILSAEAQAAHVASVSHLRMAHVRAASPELAGSAQPKVMGTQTLPGVPTPNPFRAYPPSCAADPLPDKASGTSYSARVPLYATQTDITTGNVSGTIENVTVTVWRLPCSSSGSATPYNTGGFTNAITLMRIDRDNDSNTAVTPRFPLVQASQDGSPLVDANGAPLLLSIVRSAVEPNTVISEAPFDSAMVSSTTYVLENYPYVGSGYFTFSDAFTLRLDPNITGVAPVDISVGAYTGAASSPVPITGYLSSAWYDPAHNGEGMVIQVVDNPDGVTHTVFAAWYTYDALGLPFWLIGQGTLQSRSTAISNATVLYSTNGGFAGDFGAASDSHVWGVMSLSFPDCNTLDFTYNGQTEDANGPSGSGSREWTRLVNVNGLACE